MMKKQCSEVVDGLVLFHTKCCTYMHAECNLDYYSNETLGHALFCGFFN